MNTPKLPPLPDAGILDNEIRVWTTEQMQAYAIAAIEAQGVPDEQRTRNLLARYENQWHRMGELWERCQGKGWPEAESKEFARLRDELTPATRALLLASTPPAPQATRCELCQYQHGHQIGCANNPVDIALKAQASGYGPKLVPQVSGFAEKAAFCHAKDAEQLTLKDAQAAVVQQEHDAVSYVVRWGGNCRDCADEGGVCPGSGLPCGGARKAIEHVLKALRYGVQQGYIRDPLASAQQAKPQPLSDEQMWKIWNAKGSDDMNQQEAIAFARAVEAAHGIKE